jgi:hypothetical protein
MFLAARIEVFSSEQATLGTFTSRLRMCSEDIEDPQRRQPH